VAIPFAAVRQRDVPRSRYRARRARYALCARTTAATPKETAAPNARLNMVIHMSRSYCRRERDWSLCHRRLYCLCVMADDGVTVRPIRAIVQRIVILDKSRCWPRQAQRWCCRDRRPPHPLGPQLGAGGIALPPFAGPQLGAGGKTAGSSHCLDLDREAEF
jgi:hypothetical protein